MKKVVALIFRLSFIIMCTWAFLENSAYQLNKFKISLISLTNLLDLFFLIVMTLCFIFSIKGSISEFMNYPKRFTAFASVVVLIINFSNLNTHLNIQWILNILIPLMIFLDWILFDSKGHITLYEAVWWIFSITAVATALSFLKLFVFNGTNFYDSLIYAVNFNKPIYLFLYSCLTALILYFTDNLFKLGKNNSTDFFKLLFRMLFIIALSYSFYRISSGTLFLFFTELKNFEVIANTLCFLLMCVTIILDLSKKSYLGKKPDKITRIKGYFMFMYVIIFVKNYFVVSPLKYGNVIACILLYACPIYMLLDWLCFNRKGCFKWYDPILWMILPSSYFIYASLMKFTFLPARDILISVSVFSICAGYLIFCVDFLLGKTKY